jgi:hypothetical protein
MFAKLDSGITESSLWCEKDHVRLVFIAFLAKKDHNGFVKTCYERMRTIANLTSDTDGSKFADAIKILESPDPHSTTPDFNGRRIERVQGGWMVLNHKKYRDYSYSSSPFAVAQREYRERLKGKQKPEQQPEPAPKPVPKKKESPMPSEKNSIMLDNGRTIPFSFFQKLAKYCNDKDQAARIIYRAKDKETPMAWITEGMKKENPYALAACPDEDTNPQKVRAWIDTKIYRITPGTVGEELKRMEVTC